MRTRERSIVLLFGCFLMIFAPEALRLRAAEPAAADKLPDGAVAYLGWNDLGHAWGLDEVSPGAVRDLIQLLGEDDRDVRVASELAALALMALRAQGGAALYHTPAKGDGPGLTLLSLVNPGDQRDAFEAQVSAMAGKPDDTRTLAIGGATLHRLSDESEKPLAAWTATPAGYLLIVSDADADTLGALVSRIGKGGASLAGSAAMKSALGPITPSSGAGMVFFADVRALVEQFAKPGLAAAAENEPWAARLMDALRIEGVQSIYAQTIAGEDTSSQTFVRLEGPRRGLLKLLDQKPLSEDDLKLLPAGLYWGSVSNLDLLALWNEAQSVIESVNPDLLPQVEGGLSAARAVVGFSITDDLLPALGDTWALFDTPAHGGFYGSGTVLVAEANDAKRLNGILLRLVEILTPILAQQGVQLSANEVESGARTVHYVVIGGVPSPVAPAWTFADGRFVFGLLPQTVAIAADEIDPATRGPRLIDDAGVRAALAASSDPLIGFDTADTHYLMHMVHGLLTHGVAALASMSPQKPEALARLPHLSTFLKGPRYSSSTARTTADGVLYETRGASLAAGSAAAVAVLISVLLPSLSRAREQAKRVKSMSNLRQIGMGLHMYAVDNQDRFPDSLQALLDKQYLQGEDVLRSPLQPDQGAVSYVYIPGLQLTRLQRPAQTIVAYEKIASNEGTHVLFADAHVRWMSYYEFREALEETYKLLGREGEIPPNVGP